MSPTTPRILLLGGHGKISLLMTPKILARSWDLTSVTRNPDQKATILSAGKDGPGKLDVLVRSLEDVKSDSDAKAILDEVKPDWVVWSAGAGGKGGPDRTNAIDRDACIHFIRSSLSYPKITKFLLVSAVSIRRNRASWFDDASYAEMLNVNEKVMPTYYKAKLAADDVLTVLGEEKKGFGYIDLRPGLLLDDAETGKVVLGKTKARGGVTRGDVASVAVELLGREGARGWFDLLGGPDERPIKEEVDRVLSEGVNSIEGEDLEVMKKSLL